MNLPINPNKPKWINTQRNYCLTLVRKAKKYYFNKQDHENVTDNKTFRKSVKPFFFFSGKDSTHNKITLVEQDLILDKNDNAAEVLNKFFINVISNLNIPKYHDKSVNIDHFEDPISIEQYKNHPTIVAIKSKSTNKYFKFNSISKTEIETKISNTDSSKACQDSNIPTRVIKSNSDIFTDP